MFILYACGLQCMDTICVMAMWVSMLVVASYLFIRKLWWICQISNQYICWKIFTIINVQVLNRQQMLSYSNRRRGQNDIVNFTLIIVVLCGTFALNFDVESKYDVCPFREPIVRAKNTGCCCADRSTFAEFRTLQYAAAVMLYFCCIYQ